MKAFLTANEVAKLLGVDRATVTRWIKKGLIKNVNWSAGARQWRIPLSVYEQLAKRK